MYYVLLHRYYVLCFIEGAVLRFYLLLCMPGRAADDCMNDL